MRSPQEVRALCDRYLSTSKGERPGDLTEQALSDADVLLAICAVLAEKCNRLPGNTLEEAAHIYRWVDLSASRVGFFDDRDYILGETAFIAAGACRLLGNREEAEVWLDRADSSYRLTINPAPSLARVASERLTLYYDMRRYERVFEFLPSLIRTFEGLKMVRYALKCRFLEALSLKDTNRPEVAEEKLEDLRRDPALAQEATLFGMVFANLAELLSARGEYGKALVMLRQGLALDHKPLVAAQLRVAAAECLRCQGDLVGAVDFYRSAIADYAQIEMAAHVAYLRLILAETLLAISRNREAEWEILAALPTIEEQKMAPEGFAAVSLLQESVRQRRADQNALRSLREHVQATR